MFSFLSQMHKIHSPIISNKAIDKRVDDYCPLYRGQRIPRAKNLFRVYGSPINYHSINEEVQNARLLVDWGFIDTCCTGITSRSLGDDRH